MQIPQYVLKMGLGHTRDSSTHFDREKVTQDVNMENPKWEKLREFTKSEQNHYNTRKIQQKTLTATSLSSSLSDNGYYKETTLTQTLSKQLFLQ